MQLINGSILLLTAGYRFGGIKKILKREVPCCLDQTAGYFPILKSLTTEVVTLLSLTTYPMSEISPKECGYHD
ncbi:MAG TPA: hypothetical protein DEF89_09530 [Desulfosporosinus sp.]|nr:hypothetical protein [Desulfosporosinus sp.]